MKVIKSTSEKWSGSVEIADPMTMLQVKAVEDALSKFTEEKKEGGRVWFSEVDEAMLPAVFACVEKWELSGFPSTVTVETFPATPRTESHKLIRWLFNEIYKVYIGEVEIPNA